MLTTSYGFNRSFVPRFDLAVVSGSGSASVDSARLVFINSCAFNANKLPFVAVIGLSVHLKCTPCARMVEAIREGASGIVFLRDGSTDGYPRYVILCRPPVIRKSITGCLNLAWDC